MLYREVGDFKTTYRADGQTFPIAFDRYRYYAVLAIAFLVVPFLLNDYWVKAIVLPFLIYSIAAIGLNILTGYCGQVSLGSGGFMAVGAYTCYKFMTGFDVWLPWGEAGAWVQYALPPLNIFFSVILGGVMTALVGILFGLPSLRIKGFYLAVATLAAQFFLVWVFNKWAWSYNYSASGQITAPERLLFGYRITGPETQPFATYLFCLVFVVLLALVARNLTRGHLGRSWMAIRDMDIAAEIIGVNPMKAKLTAFAISSFYIGVAGALLFAVYLGAVEVGEVFGIQKSFLILFMIIIGGLGSIFGSFAGAAFMVLLPVLLKNVLVGQPVEVSGPLSVLSTLLLWIGIACAVIAVALLVKDGFRSLVGRIRSGRSAETVGGASFRVEVEDLSEHGTEPAKGGIGWTRRMLTGPGRPGLATGLLIAAVIAMVLHSFMVGGLGWPTDIAAHFEFAIVGALIVFFLIVEPHGLAQLWRIIKEKLRLWPFPH